MANDNVKLTMDAQDLESTLNRVIALWRAKGEAVENARVKSIGFDTAGNAMRATIEGITKSGEVLTQSLKRLVDEEGELEDTFVTTNASMRKQASLASELAAENREAARATEELRRAQSQQQQAQTAENFLSLIRPKNMGQFSPREQQNLEVAERRLKDFVAANDGVVDRIDEMWDEVSNNVVRSHGGALGRLKELLGNVNQAYQAMGVDANRVLAEMKRRTDAINESNARATRNRVTVSTFLNRTRPTLRSSHTEQERAKLFDAEEALDKYVHKTSISLKKINDMWGKLQNGEIEEYKGDLVKMFKILVRLKDAQEGLGAAERKRSKEAVARLREEREAAAASRRATAAGARISASLPMSNVASIPEQDAYTNAKRAVMDFVNTNRTATKDVANVWRVVLGGATDTYKGKLGRLQRLMQDFRRIAVASGSDAAAAIAKQAAETEKLNAKTKETKRHTGGVLLSWQSIIRLGAVSMIHRAVSALTMSTREAVRGFIDLQIAISEIETLTKKISNVSLQNLIIEQSNAFGLNVADVAESAYETLSNQITDTEDDLRAFMTTANEFALATASSAEDSVNLLSSAINAFGMDVSQVDEIAASFFKTIDLGRVRASELANIYGRVAVPANQLGVSMNELNSALGLMTIRGVKTDESMTFLRNIFLKMIRPTEAMKQLYREIGVESGEAAFEIYGFSGFMQLLEDRTRGSSNELGELFGRIRAITGAMMFSGEALKDYQSVLERVTESMASYQRAVELVQNNVGRRWKKAVEQIKNYFINDLVSPILKSLDNITNGFELITPILRTLTSVIKVLTISAILPMTASLWGMAKAAVAADGALRKLALRNPILLGITATIAAITVAWEIHNQVVQAGVRRRVAAYQEEFQARREVERKLQRSFDETVRNLEDAFMAQRRIIVAELAEQRGLYATSMDAVVELYKDAEREIKKTMRESTNSLTEGIREVERELNRVRQNIESNEQTLLRLSSSFEDEDFSLSIENMDIDQQIAQMTQRLAELSGMRVGITDQDEFNEMTRRINALFRARVQLQRQLAMDNEEAFDTDAMRRDLEILYNEERRLREGLLEIQRREEQRLADERLRQIAREEQLRTAFRDIERYNAVEISQMTDPRAIERALEYLQAAWNTIGDNFNALGANRANLIAEAAEQAMQAGTDQLNLLSIGENQEAIDDLTESFRKTVNELEAIQHTGAQAWNAITSAQGSLGVQAERSGFLRDMALNRPGTAVHHTTPDQVDNAGNITEGYDVTYASVAQQRLMRLGRDNNIFGMERNAGDAAIAAQLEPLFRRVMNLSQDEDALRAILSDPQRYQALLDTFSQLEEIAPLFRQSVDDLPQYLENLDVNDDVQTTLENMNRFIDEIQETSNFDFNMTNFMNREAVMQQFIDGIQDNVEALENMDASQENLQQQFESLEEELKNYTDQLRFLREEDNEQARIDVGGLEVTLAVADASELDDDFIRNFADRLYDAMEAGTVRNFNEIGTG